MTSESQECGNGYPIKPALTPPTVKLMIHPHFFFFKEETEKPQIMEAVWIFPGSFPYLHESAQIIGIII